MHEPNARSGARPGAPSSRVFGRRTLMRVALAGAATAAGGALLAACGAEGAVPTATAAPTPRPTTAATIAPTAATAPTVAPTTAAAAPTTAPAAAPAMATVAPTTAPATSAATAAATAAPTTAMQATAAPVATTAPASGMTTATTAMSMAARGAFPSTGRGVPDAFLTLPPPFKSVSMVPGKGGKVTMLQGSQLPPPTPRDQNPYWLELDKRLGVTTERTVVPLTEYAQKMAALIASDSLPELSLVRASTAPDLSRVLSQGAFADLTPFLTGEALKEYPNLARYPDYTWRNSAIRGKLYGLPFQNFLVGSNHLMYRRDWAEKLGLPDPKNAEEVFQLLTGMSKNDPDGNRTADTFGIASNTGAANNGGGPLLLPFIQAMFRVPNQWRRNPDGTLTSAIETDEFRAAVAYARRLWEGGAYHPDSAMLTSTQWQDLLIGGKIGGINAGPQDPYAVRAPRDAAKKINPAAEIRMLLPPGHDGGKAVTWNNSAVNGIVSIPARVGRDAGRVRDLLRIADYQAAAFGSEEWKFIAFGFEGMHHTIQPNGAPVLTDRGRADVNEFPAMLFPTRVFFFTTAQMTEEEVKYAQNTAKDAIAIGVDNPALNAFSLTQAMRTSELNQLAADRVNAIVTGREPLTALDAYIRDWRSRAGDTIRRELQDELRAQ